MLPKGLKKLEKAREHIKQEIEKQNTKYQKKEN